jgi:NADPH:quinone reductase-like Zn-dependent oxidoreductase
MEALVMRQYGEPEVLKLESFPKPTIQKPTETLVKVSAAGVNVGEAIVRSGRVKAVFGVKLPGILGFDFSGTVTEVGPNSTFKVGDEIYGHMPMPRGGTQAQFVVIDETKDFVAVKPSNLTHEEAGGVGVPALTAYAALITSGKIDKNNDKKNVLVIGASGAVGSWSVLIAKQIFNANVIGICSGKNAEYVKKLGAEKVIDYTTENIPEVLKSMDARLDVVVDTIGRDYYGKIKPFLAKGGIVSAVSLPVNVAQGDPLGFGSGIGMLGSVIYRSFFGSYKMVSQAGGPEFKILNNWFKEGKLSAKAINLQAMPLANGSKAHAALDSSRVVGKIVLIPPP